MYTSLNCDNIQIFRCILNLFFCLVLPFLFYFLFFSELVISKEPQTSVPTKWRDVTLHSGTWKGQAEAERTGGCLSHPGYDMPHAIEPWLQTDSPWLERLVWGLVWDLSHRRSIPKPLESLAQQGKYQRFLPSLTFQSLFLQTFKQKRTAVLQPFKFNQIGFQVGTFIFLRCLLHFGCHAYFIF